MGPRSNSSNPSQMHHTAMPRSSSPTNLAVRTTGHSPSSSPGLFSPTSSRAQTSAVTDGSSSPGLHALHHLGTPRETTRAEVDRDMFTGLKTINYYEVLREIGRGRQGKVKFARNLEFQNKDGSEIYCAIKIVPRASGRRRLGRIAEPTTDVKREIAILKMARHSNVVALYEVIDDPEYKKVYLILEYVERGEIIWRKHAPDSILRINNSRWQLEKLGIPLTLEASEGDRYKVELDWRRHTDVGRRAEHALHQKPPRGDHFHASEETDDEWSPLSRNASVNAMERSNTPSRGNSHDDYDLQQIGGLDGSYYGSYQDMSRDLFHNRRSSLAFSAVSHMSSEHEGLLLDEQEAYVPTLTFAEARRSFRDVLLGLEFLHHIGIIHRDIKPANLLVSQSGEVKISDFGVSYLGKPLTEEEADNQVKKEEAGEEEVVGDDRELAKSVGTPAFWAPELCYDDTSIFADNAPPKITGALDLWSLGVTLYCMVYARLPFYAVEDIGLHEAICTAEPFLPTTRLVPVEDESPCGSSNSNKRFEYELKFEYVPETVRDLIRKLLVKDPSKRMTIKQAKNHPWVVEGLQNPTQFLRQIDLPEEGKEKIAELAEQELEKAVKTLTYVQKAVSNVKSAVGSIAKTFSTSRKRGTSVATSTSASSDSLAPASSSSGSTVGRPDRSREGRRRSLKPEEMASVLKATRENTGDHPLSQSQTASPDQTDMTSYFPEPDVNVKAVTTTVRPTAEHERRPQMSERAISSMSTADSVKTIRAPQPTQRASILDNQDSVKTTLNGVSNTISSIWEGASRGLKSSAGRAKSVMSNGRSASSSRKSSDGDVHTLPTVAVTSLNASGDLEAPARLRKASPRIDTSSPMQPTATYGATRQSVVMPTSSAAAFQEATEINRRKQIHEISRQDTEDRFRTPENFADDECPPSPDDITFLNNLHSRRPEPQKPSSTTEPAESHGVPIQTLPSASTIASSTDDPFSYSSNVSQRISNPSLGLGSGASSPPGESYLSPDKEHYAAPSADNEAEYMRTAEYMHTADMIPAQGRLQAPATAGKSLEQQGMYEDADDDHAECEDDGDSSDDGGIMMGSVISRRC